MTPETVAEPEAVTLPVDTLREAIPYLRRPFTINAVKFKVQATWPKGEPTGGLIVAYMDARLVTERLNAVYPEWDDDYLAIDGKTMWCKLTICGVTHKDVGEGTGKALVSDAFKRAAVRFGVGVSLYAIPKMMLSKGEGLKAQGSGDRKTLLLTDEGEARCRALYAAWLASDGIAAFGHPLDHGDSEGAVGDVDAIAAEQPTGPRLTRITKKRAGEIFKGAQLLDVVDKLRMAATHAAGGEDVGECDTKTKAELALTVLTEVQADKVERWLEKKAAEQGEPS